SLHALFSTPCHLLALHSFPTRRSSDLRRISVRLGAGLAGVGLLVLGTILIRLFPDQWQIGELMRALAAGVVAVPTLVSGLRGMRSEEHTSELSHQIISYAVFCLKNKNI